MIKLDSRTIRGFIDEELEFFVNARVQKIQQPTRKELIFTLRNNGVAKKLYINIHPDFYHLCFMNAKNEKLRRIIHPKEPPMFCMLLRKHLEGAKITDIRVLDGERIVELIFQNYSEFAKEDSLCLAIELMGKHSNVVLYDFDSKNILGCAHNIGEEKSRERELAGGIPYSYPPIRTKQFIEKYSFDNFFNEIKKSQKKLHEFISETFFDFTIFISQKLCKETILNYDNINVFTKEDLFKLYQRMLEFVKNNNYVPCINEKENYFLLFGNSKECIKCENISDMIDEYFAKNYAKFLMNNLTQSLEAKLVREIKKYKNTIKKLTITESDKQKTKNYKKNADLIMTNLYALKNNFSDTIQVIDFETNETIKIQVDVTKTPIENANNFYKLYNKGKKAEEISIKFIDENNEKMNILEDFLFSVKNADSVDELEDIAFEVGLSNSQNKKKIISKEINVPSLEINGYKVYTGKNNKQNDLIYSKISSPDDIWFHALNTSGAHILLKTKKNETPDNATLYECAKLAKQLSNSRNSGKSLVIFTKRQFIKRPPNTKSGYVTFKNETEVVVDTLTNE